jgi:hypothetical protein
LLVLGVGAVLLLFAEAILSIWVESQRPPQEQGTLFGHFVIPGFLQVIANLWLWLQANAQPILVIIAVALIATAGWLISLTRHLSAASRDIRAAQAMESPFLIPELNGVEEEDFRGRRRPVAVYSLRNNGRSPAILRRLQDAIVIGERLPAEYDEIWLGETLRSRPAQYIAIGPVHAPAPERTGMRFRCPLKEADIGRSGKRYLVARFEFDDLLGTSYVQGFSMQLPALGSQHVISGDAVYNYRRALAGAPS